MNGLGEIVNYEVSKSGEHMSQKEEFRRCLP